LAEKYRLFAVKAKAKEDARNNTYFLPKSGGKSAGKPTNDMIDA
jgi:hypothetical protein